jgi:hypothetical protein
VDLFQGNTQIGTRTTKGGGVYRFSMLPPGTYTLREADPGWLRFSSTPNQVTFSLNAGLEAAVNFGDWNGQPVWLPLIVR